MLDEMERALHDALCIVKRTLESNTVTSFYCLLETLAFGNENHTSGFTQHSVSCQTGSCGWRCSWNSIVCVPGAPCYNLGLSRTIGYCWICRCAIDYTKGDLQPSISSIKRFVLCSRLIIQHLSSHSQVLAVNAAKDATELVAKLRAYHHTAQTKADKKHYSR